LFDKSRKINLRSFHFSLFATAFAALDAPQPSEKATSSITAPPASNFN
jgi:hypothetical protein